MTRRLSGVLCVVLFCFVFSPIAVSPLMADETVTFFENAFLPTTVTITQGESVIFVWDEGTHTITSGDDEDDPESGDLFEELLDEDNPEFRFQFNEPGIFTFYDADGGSLPGTVFVNEFAIEVAVLDNEFAPIDVVLFEGDKTHWIFDGDLIHTVTSGPDPDDADAGDLFDETIYFTNLEFEYLWEEAGFYEYHCIPHWEMGMVGTITVQKKFIRGDANGDESLSIADPITMLEYLFLDGDESSCLDRLDGDDDGEVTLDDVFAVLDAFFLEGGEDLPAPYPIPGPDRTEDDNLCE